MTREALPFVAPDLSAFARSLGQALKERQQTRAEPPGHVEMLNLIARAAGHRNVQALRAASVAAPPIARTVAEPAPALSDNARRTLMQFDEQGRLVRWPSKFTVQRLAMWPLWSLFEARRVYTEKEVNAILKAAHTYGDHVTLRRELINHHLLTRKNDCSAYRKLPARPDEEARAVMHAWRARMRGAAALQA